MQFLFSDFDSLYKTGAKLRTIKELQIYKVFRYLFPFFLQNCGQKNLQANSVKSFKLCSLSSLTNIILIVAKIHSKWRVNVKR